MAKLHWKINDYTRKKLLNSANNYYTQIESATDWKDIIMTITQQAQYVLMELNSKPEHRN
jgi:hypothetical protein